MLFLISFYLSLLNVFIVITPADHVTGSWRWIDPYIMEFTTEGSSRFPYSTLYTVELAKDNVKSATGKTDIISL